MLLIPWSAESGWATPRIEPCTSFDKFICTCNEYLPIVDGPLSLEPSSTVLHYAQTIFEGTKAYRRADGTITLFRPDMNMKRMNTSAHRIALPVRFCLWITVQCLSRPHSEF